ncbi:tripartite tricarboxylate transporter substrate binding protein [Ruegeria sp. EL01]|jgi:tripartite-type tricarboxylate transporter receptor subunit TctC|uniref:tripartite tricarboxylate transporter substrate binding protein n=1 Tax=Ruegeria sp. EL01 TaxID=2107578 RepID=UPI000EA836DC|nr:tripartite tricarboxylate transporter substrate binding protein [Ruegeria sp. EL01]
MNISKTFKATLAAALLTLPGAAFAEWEPDGPITLQIGFGSGGSTDTLGRAIAASMEESTGWDVIVENKPGGGGVAMFSSLVREDADGTTLGIGVTIPTLMNLATRGEKLPFKADSFDYLATIVLAPLALVAPADAPYNTVAEFVEHSKANGGSLIGFDAGPQRMIMRAVNKSADAGFEMVSHKSGAEIIQGLLGGQLQAGFGAGAHIQYLDSGDLKMLAVATQSRQGYSPDTPSFIEQGFPYSVEPYFYIAAPDGLDDEAKAALAKALDDAINSASMTELIGNIMQTTPNNLGPDGTEAKLVNGLSDISALLAASED